MGFHIAYRLTKTPVVVKDGGTGSWRDAKKIIRQWYLNEASNLRDVTERSYFAKSVEEVAVEAADSMERLARV